MTHAAPADREPLEIDDEFDSGMSDNDIEAEEELRQKRLVKLFKSLHAAAADLNATATSLNKVSAQIAKSFNFRIADAAIEMHPMSAAGVMGADDDVPVAAGGSYDGSGAPNEALDDHDAMIRRVGAMKRTRAAWTRKNFLAILGISSSVLLIGVPGLVIAGLTLAATADGVAEAKKANLPTPPKVVPFDLMSETDLKDLGFTDAQLQYLHDFVATWLKDAGFWDTVGEWVAANRPSLEAQFVIMRYTQDVAGPSPYKMADGQIAKVTKALVSAYETSATATQGPSTVALYQAIKAYKDDDGTAPPRNVAALFCQMALAVIYKNRTLQAANTGGGP